MATEKEWFKHAFDASYVRRYAHRSHDEANDFVATIRLLFSESVTGKTALDVACGAGRHALALSRLGFQVTGIDLSEELIDLARKFAQKEENPPRFLVGDMRDEWPDGPYDLILNAFTSFGYFDKDEESFSILQQARQQLSPAGYFILDYFNTHRVIDELVPKSIRTLEGKRIVEERWIENGRVKKRITTLAASPSGESSVIESVRLFYPSDLRRMFTRAGLTLVEEWGTYDGSPFILNSPRYIAVMTPGPA